MFDPFEFDDELLDMWLKGCTIDEVMHEKFKGVEGSEAKLKSLY